MADQVWFLGKIWLISLAITGAIKLAGSWPVETPQNFWVVAIVCAPTLIMAGIFLRRSQ